MRKFAAAFLLALAAHGAWAADDIRALFPGPQEVSGWSIHRDIRQYSAGEILDWRGEEGGIFADYGFQQGADAEYAGVGEATVSVEIYRMKSPADAFGVWGYHRPQKAERLEIARDAYIAGGVGGLWKGGCFVRVRAREETPAAGALRDFLAVVSSKIPDAGPLPDIFRVLEIEGHLKGSLRYLHTKRALDSLHFVAEENVLKLHEKTEVVLGKFFIDNRLFDAFLAVYPNEQEAVSAAASLAAFLGRNPQAEATWYKQRGRAVVGAWTGLKVPETLDSEYMIYDTIKELLRQVKIFQLDK